MSTACENRTQSSTLYYALGRFICVSSAFLEAVEAASNRTEPHIAVTISLPCRRTPSRQLSF